MRVITAGRLSLSFGVSPLHAMRAFIVFLLSCASVLGADTDLRLISTAKTNVETASVYTTDVFTRNGQTNLVRTTKTKAGKLQIRIQKFYHDGLRVGAYVASRDSSGFSVEPGCPYSVTVEFWPSKDIRSVVFGTNGVVMDAFMATNGVFYPADISVIQRANAVGADMRELFDPEHVRKSTPEGFVRDAEKLIEKHKEK